MTTLVSLKCDWCSTAFERRLSDVMNPGKRNRKHFCSRACVIQWQRNGESLARQCKNCGSTFERPRRRNDQRKFCSLSCAASHNNRRRPPRATTSRCDTCGARKSRSSQQCRGCLREKFMSRTLKSLREEYPTPTFHAKVRGLARNAYRGPMWCAACGYSLHVDICHIKGVAAWPPEATLADVNDPSNLVALDKRCHWEFDNGYLIYKDGLFLPSRPN